MIGSVDVRNLLRHVHSASARNRDGAGQSGIPGSAGELIANRDVNVTASGVVGAVDSRDGRNRLEVAGVAQRGVGDVRESGTGSIGGIGRIHRPIAGAVVNGGGVIEDA